MGSVKSKILAKIGWLGYSIDKNKFDLLWVYLFSSLRALLNIFPTFVFGSSSLNSTCLGILYPVKPCFAENDNIFFRNRVIFFNYIKFYDFA